MAELAMLADIQRTEEVTRQLHIMAQARESLLIHDILTTVLHHRPVRQHFPWITHICSFMYTEISKLFHINIDKQLQHNLQLKTVTKCEINTTISHLATCCNLRIIQY